MADSVTPLTGAPEQEWSNATYKLQAMIDPRTHYVLKRLRGVWGRSVADVAYYLLRDWIRANQAELDHLGITTTVAGGPLVIRPTDEDDTDAGAEES